MRLGRNLALVTFGAVAFVCLGRTPMAADCDAASYIDCTDCQYLTEDYCDDLCYFTNNGNPPCEDWIYSQEGPQCQFIGPGQNECAVGCHCAPDEPL